jgi:hypothetical protein
MFLEVFFPRSLERIQFIYVNHFQQCSGKTHVQAFVFEPFLRPSEMFNALPLGIVFLLVVGETESSWYGGQNVAYYSSP